jgi:hypothetical protein
VRARTHLVVTLAPLQQARELVPLLLQPQQRLVGLEQPGSHDGRVAAVLLLLLLGRGRRPHPRVVVACGPSRTHGVARVRSLAGHIVAGVASEEEEAAFREFCEGLR